MKKEQLHELLYQALETEQGGIAVYTTALRCALNDDLKKEWQEYLDQTTHHEEIVRTLFDKLGLDPAVDTPGRHGRAAHRRVAGRGDGDGARLPGRRRRRSSSPPSAWCWPRRRTTSTGS